MGYDLSWIGPDGLHLELALGDEATTGVWVTGITGFEADVSLSSTDSATGVGSDITSFAIGDIDGSIDLRLDPRAAGSMLTASQVWSRLQRAFNPIRPGILRWSQPDGQVLSAAFRLNGKIDEPDVSPHAPWVQWSETSLSLTSADGLWTGLPDPGVQTDEGVRLRNAGDFAAYVDVAFTGGGTVSIAGAPPVALPNIAAPRVLSTDPGGAYKIIDPATGRVDVEAWSSMRGQPVPGRIEPGQIAMATTTGTVTVSVTPRFTTPWR